MNAPSPPKRRRGQRSRPDHALRSTCPNCGGWRDNPWWTAAYRSGRRWLVAPAHGKLGARPTVRIRRKGQLCTHPFHGGREWP